MGSRKHTAYASPFKEQKNKMMGLSLAVFVSPQNKDTPHCRLLGLSKGSRCFRNVLYAGYMDSPVVFGT